MGDYESMFGVLGVPVIIVGAVVVILGLLGLGWVIGLALAAL